MKVCDSNPSVIPVRHGSWSAFCNVKVLYKQSQVFINSFQIATFKCLPLLWLDKTLMGRHEVRMFITRQHVIHWGQANWWDREQVAGEDPVLKINNHATGGWRTKDILGGPKSLETKELGSSKGWEDQSAEKTNNWKDKKISNKPMETKKLNISLKTGGPKKFWEDQRAWTKDLLGGPKTFWSAVGGPKRILRTEAISAAAQFWRLLQICFPTMVLHASIQ